MVVYSLTNAPQRTRGLLSRYCLEVRPGLFVGRLDKRMRLKLWGVILDDAGERTTAVMAWSRPTAQGYAFRSHGPAARRPPPRPLRRPLACRGEARRRTEESET